MSSPPDLPTALLCASLPIPGVSSIKTPTQPPLAWLRTWSLTVPTPRRIALEVYQSQRIEYLRLESLVMGRIKTVADGRVAYSFARAADLERRHVSQDECDGLVDVVRSVQGVEVCLFLKESQPGCIRGNLRSKGALDVSGVAAPLEGVGTPPQLALPIRERSRRRLSAPWPQLAELVGADPASICVTL